MNEFLTLLLPWPFNGTPNVQILDIFVYGILLFFLICVVIFLAKTIHRGMFINKLTVEISRFAEEVGRSNRPAEPQILHELKEKFPTKGELAEAWQEFEDSLITDENRVIVYKTDEASLFFSEERLLGQYMNLRFWNSVPAILVGLGILGTFVGLVSGLIPFSKINFEQTSELQGAIKQLLSGVSTAFVTSVWGMLGSLIFNVLEKWRISRVNKAIANLQRALDQLFTLITQEAISVQNKDLLEQLTAAFKSSATDLADAIAEKLTPSINRVESAIDGIKEGQDNLTIEIQKVPEVFNETLKSSFESLHDAIVNPETGVKNTIRNETQKVVQQIEIAPNTFSDAIVKQLGPSLDELNETVKELRKEKDESSTEAIRELVEEFKKALSGSFTEEIETLVKNLSTVSQSLLELPDQMKTMMDGVQVKIDEICVSLQKAIEGQTTSTEDTIRTIMQELRKAIDELKGVIDSTTSTAATESAEIIKQIHKSVEAAADRLNNIFEEGEKRVSTLLEKQEKLIEAVDSPISKSQEILEKGNVLLDEMNTSLKSTNDMIVTMQAFSDELKGSADTLKTAGENLTEASNVFNQQNAEYLEANQKTNQQIQESLRQSQILLNAFAEKFNTIESGLQDIFKEIHKGLIDYSTTTHDSIEKSLEPFTKELTTAAEALAGSVSALEGSFEELSEMIQRFLHLRGNR